MLAATIWSAFMATLQFLLTLYQVINGAPPSQPQIVEIFNQTTTVISTVVNLPPPPGQGG